MSDSYPVTLIKHFSPHKYLTTKQGTMTQTKLRLLHAVHHELTNLYGHGIPTGWAKWDDSEKTVTLTVATPATYVEHMVYDGEKFNPVNHQPQQTSMAILETTFVGWHPVTGRPCFDPTLAFKEL